MTGPIRQILYASIARASTETGVIDDILAVSRRNNARDGVTGLLYGDGGRYLQALEGEANAVQRTFERISADPRHHEVEILSDRTIAAREFGTWSMTFYRDTDDRAGVDQAMRAALTTAAPIVRNRFLDLLDD